MLSVMPFHRTLIAGTILCIALLAATAQATVTLRIDDVAGNPGDVVESSLFMTTSGGDAPTVLQLFITYDPAYVVPDATFYQDGTSPLQPSAALLGAGIGVQSEIFSAGVLSVVVFGLASPVIPASAANPILNIAFLIKATAPDNISVNIDGRTASEPVDVNGTPSFCTAANAASASLTVAFNDGAIVVGCVPQAAAPTNVTASLDRADGVLVAWAANSGSGNEYRVFRSLTPAFVTAEPLGTTWTAQTSYLDTTAAAPTTPDGAGCTCPAPDPVVTTYYYWVVARTAAGCAGDPSQTPAQGARSAAKFAPESSPASVTSIPGKRDADGLRPVAADGALAVRLIAADALDATQIWGQVHGVDAAEYTLDELPGAGPGDVWLRATPKSVWPEVGPLYFEAGGQTVTGAPVEGVVVGFVVTPAGKDAGDGLQAVDPATLPFLENGLNAPYALLPEGVYDAPRRVLIPVPAGEDAQTLNVYYLNDVDGAATWHAWSAVPGWLDAAPEVVNVNGAAYLAIAARHSGVLQLGLPETAATASAAMPPFAWTPGQRGDSLLAALLLGVGFLVSARLRRRENA